MKQFGVNNNAGAAASDMRRVATDKLKKDAIEVGKMADKAVAGVKNIVPTRNVMALDRVGNVRVPAENTHFFENKIRNTLSKAEGVNVGGKGTRNISTGNFGFKSTGELKGYQHQIDKELKRHGITVEQFNGLRLKPVTELTSQEVKIMKEIRDAVPPITENTLLQKTIPASDVEKYLSGEYTEIGGYVAKAEDVSGATRYNNVIESLRLDYTSWGGTRPYPKDGDSYAMIRFKTSQIDEIDIPYGERLGGKNTDGPPCTLNGFTGARNGKIIPEWEFNHRYLPEDGAELYKVTDGVEEILAIYDEKLQRFMPVK